jgi:adenosylcobinamide kinase/adenosylcobinamide-phosphate guanylyltransferase
MPPSHVLVTGGQRSGKSRFAARLAIESGLAPHLIATAQAGDAEMAERIARHRGGRDAAWRVIEEPLALAAAIDAEAADDRALVVDCLTLWLANLMAAGEDETAATRDLLAALGKARGPVILVTNEVGSGIIPDNALARRFADAQGFLNQAVARDAAKVVLMTAGIPLLVKPGSGGAISL